MRKLILATRSSRLAVAQSEIVRDALLAQGAEVSFLYVETAGDTDKKSPLQKIGGDGLFVRKVEQAVLSGQADIAVHCGKDLPYRIEKGLCIAGIPDAADERDVLLWRKGEPLSDDAVIGTGSSRRIAEYARINANAQFADIRGNVTMRLKKLQQGAYDGIILAKAGLDRLNIDLQEFGHRILETDEMIPAVCQGILAAECREDDAEARRILEAITEQKAKQRFTIERNLFQKLQADCSKAVGVYAGIADGRCRLSALFGEKRAVAEGACGDYEKLTEEILARLM
ncbi:MAG: hydroxymethylbilane synthase [Lachnospiraceae bacterium]|nr:hydroxymethylbilane synthase [Lachnospiraceae bacterium]